MLIENLDSSELDRQVRSVYYDCVGKSFGMANMDVSTLDLLKRIELQMEMVSGSPALLAGCHKELDDVIAGPPCGLRPGPTGPHP